jgi:glycosyltransferase involved in cell wall biosynthesis
MTASAATGGTERSVLFVHPSDEAYGADRVLLRLATGLAQRGWRVAVLMSDDQPPGWLTQRLAEASIQVARGPLAPARRRYLTPSALLAYLGGLLRARRWLRREALRFRPTIVHLNTSALLVGTILGRPGGIRVVWHVHEIVIKPRLFSWVFRLAPTLTADRVVAISRAVRDHISPGGLGRGKVTIVWNGIEDRPAVPLVVGTAPVVAFIGRLNRWKGYEVFVDAVARIAFEFPGTRFLVAGDPPPGEEWRTTALLRWLSRRGIADRVEVLGFESDVRALIERVSVVVTPSTWPEPFGLVTLEAMWAGRAVIASAHGGALDLIAPGVSGLLVPPGDASALAMAIATLIDDRALRNRLGTAARRRAQTHFSLDAFVTGIEHVYLSGIVTSASD